MASLLLIAGLVGARGAAGLGMAPADSSNNSNALQLTTAATASSPTPAPGWTRIIHSECLSGNSCPGTAIVLDLPKDEIIALASAATRVKFGNFNTGKYVVSLPNTFPIDDIRAFRAIGTGRIITAQEVDQYWEVDPANPWVREELRIPYVYSGYTLDSFVFASAGNANGAHWLLNQANWHYDSNSQPFELWIDATAAPPPTPSPAPGAGGAGAGASAVGDPHLQNIHGERFDLMKAGKHVLINIPRGMSAENTLLRVQADARRLGGQCADMYFQELNVTGSWAEDKQAGGYHYSVTQHDAKSPEWVSFGKVELKVVHGRTDSGLLYLNLYVKHLGRAGFAVGGLLGEDDHGDVSAAPDSCAQRLALVAGTRGGEGQALSFAVASLA